MKKTNNLHLGQIAQLKVELEAARRNIIVSLPTIPSRYDLIFDLGQNNIIRAQIKYCNNRDKRKGYQRWLGLNLERKHNNQKKYRG